jgi:hypothetical protein
MQRKVILANLMAPVAYVGHMRSPARYLPSLPYIMKVKLHTNTLGLFQMIFVIKIYAEQVEI